MKILKIEDLTNVTGGNAIVQWLLRKGAEAGYMEMVIEGAKYVMDNEGGWVQKSLGFSGGGSNSNGTYSVCSGGSTGYVSVGADGVPTGGTYGCGW